MSYDIDEMIKEAEKKRRSDEVILYGFGVGRIAPKLGYIRAQKKTMDYIKKLEGFIGITPIDLWHTVLLFDTLNNAKGGRNELMAKGVKTGLVVPILVPKEDVK